MIGLELVVPVLLGLVRSGALKLERLVDALTRAPARVVGLDAPRVREGATAEVVLVDPEAEVQVAPARLRSKSRNTPWLGQALRGEVRMTLAGGRVVFDRETEGVGHG
jgi:dihydroorotase